MVGKQETDASICFPLAQAVAARVSRWESGWLFYVLPEPLGAARVDKPSTYIHTTDLRELGGGGGVASMARLVYSNVGELYFTADITQGNKGLMINSRQAHR